MAKSNFSLDSTLNSLLNETEENKEMNEALYHALLAIYNNKTKKDNLLSCSNKTEVYESILRQLEKEERDVSNFRLIVRTMNITEAIKYIKGELKKIKESESKKVGYH